MSIRPETLELIDRLLTASATETEIAAALEEYVESAGFNATIPATPSDIISLFLLQHKDRLTEQQTTSLELLVFPNASQNTNSVVLHELSPSSTDPHNITSFLADGGIGRVWLAQDQQVQRKVVLKQLLPDFQDNEVAKTRFVNEAQVTGSLQHPNIVPVYSMNWDNEKSPFYTMKYIRGATLAKSLKEYHDQGTPNHSEFQQLLNNFLSVCQAIAYAHERNIVHRDLKPENVAIGEFGEVTVLDWGLADQYHPNATPEGSNSVLGTPNYMPPEQAGGEGPTGPHSDIYSLGAILYEIICGNPPRHKAPQKQGLNTLLTSIIEGDIPKATDHCPTRLQGLGHIVVKCLNTEPKSRYSKVGDLISDIRAWQNDQELIARPDNFFQSVSRRIRRNRRSLLSSAILLPATTLVLIVFVTNYNFEYSKLQNAREKEQAKQEEYLNTQRQLGQAIQLASEAKAEAEQATTLANQNRQLATSSRMTYLREQARADDARADHIAATEQAKQAEQKARTSTATKTTAKTLADNNRAQANALSQQLHYQLFDALNRNASYAIDTTHYQHALAWTTAALDHAMVSKLAAPDILEQRLQYDALKTHIPNLAVISKNTNWRVPILHEPHRDYIYFTTSSQQGPDEAGAIEKRDARTLKLIWKHPTDQTTVIAHCFHATTNNYCAVAGNSSNEVTATLYDAESGDVLVTGELELDSDRIQELYLTNDNLIVVQERALSIFSRNNFELLSSIPETESPILGAVISSDGHHLATRHGPLTLRLWDTTEGLRTSPPLKLGARIVAFQFQAISNNLQLVTTAGEQFTINSDDFIPKTVTKGNLPLSKDETITVAVFHPHQFFTAYGTSQGRVFISNASGSLVIAPLYFPDLITNVALSSDSQLLLIQSGEHALNIYDIPHREFMCRNLDHPTRLSKVVISHNNRFLYSQLKPLELRRWDLAIPASPPQQLVVGINYAHCHFDGNVILAVTNSGDVELRDSNMPSKVLDQATLGLSPPPGTLYIPHPGGLYLLAEKQLIHITHTNGNLSLDRPTLYAPVQDYAFHQPTNTLALSHSDRTISVYSPEAATPYRRLQGFPTSYSSIAWHSGKTLIGLVPTPNNQKCTVDFIPIEKPEKPVSRPLIGGGYQFIHDINGASFLVDQNGTLFNLEPETISSTQNVLGSDIRKTLPKNHTLTFMKNGTVIRIANGISFEYQTNFPDDTTPVSKSDYFALLTDRQATIYRIDNPRPIAAPLHLSERPTSIDLSVQDEAIRLLASAESGLYIYHLATSPTPMAKLAEESRVLTGTSIRDNATLQRDTQRTKNVFQTDPLTADTNPIAWLIKHSSSIDAVAWRPSLKAAEQRMQAMTDPTAQQATATTDELVTAQIGVRQYRNAVDTLRKGFTFSKQKRHLYQACLLAAWLEDPTLLQTTISEFRRHVDLRIPQEFVYFSLATGIANLEADYPLLNAAYNKLKSSNTTNPVVLRALLMNAVRLKDMEAVRRHLQQVLDTKSPLPIRNFCLSIGLAHTSPKPENLRLLRKLEHSQQISPSLREGNPGRNWAERCITDLGLRMLQLHYKGIQP